MNCTTKENELGSERRDSGGTLMVLTALLTLAGGCQDSAPPDLAPEMANSDAGTWTEASFEGDAAVDSSVQNEPVAPDAGTIDPSADYDDDGLCNGTEESNGSDPYVADTDDDGVSDYLEVVTGFDPTLRVSPGRDGLVLLNRGSGVPVLVPHAALVVGRGEDFSGAFEARPFVPGTPEASETAAFFWSGSRAVRADPAHNVGVVEEAAERFRGVVGTTELNFESAFEAGGGPSLSCARAYPFRYTVKRSDGTVMWTRDHLLLVGPSRDAEACDLPTRCI